MLALLKYKYRAGRRKTMEPLVVWTLVILFFLVFSFISFGLAFFLLQGRHPQLSGIEIWLLFAGVFQLGMNVGIQGAPGTLTKKFAQELEYLSTLPVATIKVLLVQYMGWFASNMFGISTLILAPLLAAQLDQSLPFPLTTSVLLAITTYSLLILFAGGWLKMISLRRYSLIAAPIRWAQLILSVVIILLAVPKVSSQLPSFLTMGVFTIAMLPVLPSTWAALVMNGQWIFAIPLFMLLGIVMWGMSLHLKDYWAIEIRPEQHHSYYPLRFASGSGWAVAKYLVIEALTNPTLRLASQVVMGIFGIILVRYLWNPDIRVLLFLGIALSFRGLGFRLYTHLIESGDELLTVGLPISPNEILRGFCCVLGIAYLPVFLMIFIISATITSWSPIQLLGFCLAPVVSCLGIVALALCASRRLSTFWAFATFGIFQLLASFLL